MAGGRGDDVNIPVQPPQGSLQHHHGEDGRAGGDISRANRHGVGCRHARSGIALRRCHRYAGTQQRRGIQQPRPLLGQRTGARPRRQHFRQKVAHLPREAVGSHKGVELPQHTPVKVTGVRVDGEHTGGVPHAHGKATRQPVVDIARQRGDMRHLRHVGLLFQNSLVQLGDGPAQRDVEIKQVGQLLRRRHRVGVAPREERSQLVSVAIQSQIAVHHAGNADGTDSLQMYPVVTADRLVQIAEARLHTGDGVLQPVTPQSVLQRVLPLVDAAGQHGMIRADQHGFDPSRAQLYAQCRLAGAYPADLVVTVHGQPPFRIQTRS